MQGKRIKRINGLLKGLYKNKYGVGAIEISFFGKVSHWWSDQIAISRARVW